MTLSLGKLAVSCDDYPFLFFGLGLGEFVVLDGDELCIEAAVSQGGAEFFQHVVDQKFWLFYQLSISLEIELGYTFLLL